MSEKINVELTNDECLILLKALITQNAVNGVVDNELTALMGKFNQITVKQN